MIYGSVCSGIEAATVAWHPLGWRPAFFSEIEAFPRAVLAHHYPDVPLHGDFTTIENGQYEPIDLLVGGTPCQDFSIAGLRAGLVGDRGNLTLQFLKLAQRLRPQWIVWENVPGVLSSTSHVAPDPCPPKIDLDSDDGPQDGEEVVVTDEYDADESHALACFMAGLSELNYGFAARVLDAQYFGIPQRRRREFIVGYFGDWRPAAAVLFERESLSGNPAPSRQAGQAIAGTIKAGSGGGCGPGPDEAKQGLLISGTLNANGKAAGSATQQDAETGMLVAFGGNNTSGPIDIATALSSHGGPHGRQDFESETFIAHALRGEGFDASEDGTGRGTPLVPVAFSSKDHGADAGAIAPTLRAMGYSGSHANAGGQLAVAFHENQRHEITVSETAGSLKVGGGKPGQGYPAIQQASAVRRLTPRECERLQGFPDDYTAIIRNGATAADGPRYKALGNSMPVPVMAWIGERIELVNRLLKARRQAA